ncbi:MAG: hypothetical protein KBT48_05760 [Firmicutes bacterium]|nr:hypothetical protein [Bacillota bacterium]
MRNSKKSYLYILSILYLCSVYLIPIIYLFNKEFNPFAFTIPVLLTVFNSVAAILL